MIDVKLFFSWNTVMGSLENPTYWRSLSYINFDLNNSIRLYVCFFIILPTIQWSHFSCSVIWSHTPSRRTEQQDETNVYCFSLRIHILHQYCEYQGEQNWGTNILIEIKKGRNKERKEWRREGSNKHNHFTIFLLGICPKTPIWIGQVLIKSQAFWLRPVNSYLLKNKATWKYASPVKLTQSSQ